MAWVMDSKFGQHYMSVQSSVVVSREQTKKLKWLTFEQLKNKHGMAEASAMIRARTIIMRRNPMDKRFWQFLSPEDSQAMRMKISKTVEGTQSGKASQAEFTSFEQSMGELELDEDLFNDLMEKNSADAMVVGKNMKTNKVATQEEDGEDDGLLDELKALMPIVPAKKAPKGSAKDQEEPEEEEAPKVSNFDKKVDVMTQLADDNVEKAQRKCATMHRLLIKMRQTLRKNMTKQGKRDPEMDNNSKLLDTLTKHIDGLDNLVVNKTSINTIKKSLVQATMFSICIILGSWLFFGAIEYNCGVLVPCTLALLYFFYVS
jgi:hypothetical protein